MVIDEKFKNVLVVLGGTSGERAISLESGKACIRALKRKGYKVSTFDPKKKNFNLISKKKTDVIFNALHGKNGEDGVAQSYFEYLGIPSSFILGWIFFSEAPLDQLFPGVIGIIAAGMIVIWHDRKVSEFPEQTKKIY